MKCKHGKSLLFLYAEGQLHQEERALLEKHLHACEACANLLVKIRRTISAQPPEMEAPKGFLFKVYSRINAASDAPSFSFSLNKMVRPVLKPIGFILLLAIGVYFGNWLSDENSARLRPGDDYANQAEAEYLYEMAEPSGQLLADAYFSLLE